MERKTYNAKSQTSKRFSEITYGVTLGLILGIGMVIYDTYEDTGNNSVKKEIMRLVLKMDHLKDLKNITVQIENKVLKDARLNNMAHNMFPNYTDKFHAAKYELIEDCAGILDSLWTKYPNYVVMNFPEDNYFWGLVILSCPKGPSINDIRFFGPIFDPQSKLPIY